jgi:phage host-nuclease inhibitor protein Gam
MQWRIDRPVCTVTSVTAIMACLNVQYTEHLFTTLQNGEQKNYNYE